MLLNILILLECTQSADNLFHSFTVLWETEYFLKSSLLYLSTSVKSCPLVISTVLILTNILGSIFSWPLTIFFLKKPYICPPPNIRITTVVRPHSFNRSSWLGSLSPGMSLLAFLCIFFPSIYMSFLWYGLHACIQYYKWGLTIALHRCTTNSFTLYIIFPESFQESGYS